MSIATPPRLVEIAAAPPRRPRRWIPWVVAYSTSLLMTLLALIGVGVAKYSPLSSDVLPGHRRWIEIHYRFVDCKSVSARGGSSVFDSLPVTFRLAQIKRVQEVPLLETTAIEASGPDCS